VIAVE